RGAGWRCAPCLLLEAPANASGPEGTTRFTESKAEKREEAEMARVLVIDERDCVAELLISRLHESPVVESCVRAPQQEDGYGGELSGGYAELLREQAIDTVVYCPPLGEGRRMTPDLADAEMVFQQCAGAGIKKAVVLSSAFVYGASHHNPGLI